MIDILCDGNDGANCSKCKLPTPLGWRRTCRAVVPMTGMTKVKSSDPFTESLGTCEHRTSVKYVENKIEICCNPFVPIAVCGLFRTMVTIDGRDVSGQKTTSCVGCAFSANPTGRRAADGAA